MSEIQEQIQRHIDALVGAGAETGVQDAVYQDGALIVDAVAGTADPAGGRPVTSGTPIFSVIWCGTPGVYAREETTAREGPQA
ncbi:hypothetical protein ACIBQX_12295 [Nonomuraea sp. NPDC049714]|uniref:hypothetical protein n=1 Tax=Nonomuraea sp. NPDC049714 TaxID=3364357 RepID=UPI0037A983EF